MWVETGRLVWVASCDNAVALHVGSQLINKVSVLSVWEAEGSAGVSG